MSEEDKTAAREALFEFLATGCGVPGKKDQTFSHDPVDTVDAWREALGSRSGGGDNDDNSKQEVHPQLCKNLFCKSKKGQLFLIVALAESEVKLGNLQPKANALRFAPEEALADALGLKKGSVTPLGLINDRESHRVTVLLDPAMKVGGFEDEEPSGEDSLSMLFHPLTNDFSTPLTSAELFRFLKATGHEFKSVDLAAKPAAAPKQGSKKGGAQPKKGQAQKRGQKAEKSVKSAAMGITVGKNENFSDWYSQVCVKTELIDYYDISGCYILRPAAYEMWENVKAFFDARIKRIGVKNCYFPLFITKAALCKEEDHVEGFAPEVAWVTKGGQSEMDEPIAVRPTSETGMYPAYARWIRSHRDLPLKLNQWVSVVRWEFKSPTPFLRSREFLWQEGHTVFASREQAMEEVYDILDFYAATYEELLAVPVVKGKKTEEEKFPGGEVTTTVECYIEQSGRAIQAATSHCLGQNFAKMYDVVFENDKGERQFAWQNSWGLTTRSLGIMIMTHGDDKGLVIPPRVAPTQVVFVALEFVGADNEGAKSKARELAKVLQLEGVRTEVSDLHGHNPGYIFNHWEMRGIPLRIEVGPRDLKTGTCDVVRRDNGQKSTLSMDTKELVAGVQKLMEEMQGDMFARAKAQRDSHMKQVTEWKDFVPSLNDKNMVLVPWCERQECENDIKDTSGEEAAGVVEQMDKATAAANAAGKENFVQLTGAAKSLCMPFEQPDLAEDAVCIKCGQKAKTWCLFGRSY